MTTQAESRDIIGEVVRTAWLADPTSQDIPLLWDNVKGEKPGNDANGRPLPWARVAIRHTVGGQETMGAQGARRYASGGVVQVQIFTALDYGHALSDELVQIVKSAFRSTSSPSGVWFYDERTTELGPDGPWFNVNVSATFRYEERE